MRHIVMVLALGAVLVACGGAVDEHTPTATSAVMLQPSASPPASSASPRLDERAAVHVTAFKFAPPLLTVPAGTTVTWTNADAILHTVTTGTPDAPDGRIDAQLDGQGTTFTFTFTEPGTYAYFCSRHVFMVGMVVVQ